MNKKQFAAVFLGMIVSSFLGGASAFYILNETAVPKNLEEQVVPTINANALNILSSDGTRRIRLGFSNDNPHITLPGHSRSTVIQMTVSDSGEGFLSLLNDNETSGIRLETTKTGPEVALQEFDDNNQISLSIFEQKPKLVLANKSEDLLAYITLSELLLSGEDKSSFLQTGVLSLSSLGSIGFIADARGGYGSLNLHSSLGLKLQLDASDEGAAVRVWDGKEIRAVLGATTTVNKKTEKETKTPESTLTLFDKDGIVVHQVP